MAATQTSPLTPGTATSEFKTVVAGVLMSAVMAAGAYFAPKWVATDQEKTWLLAGCGAAASGLIALYSILRTWLKSKLPVPVNAVTLIPGFTTGTTSNTTAWNWNTAANLGNAASTPITTAAPAAPITVPDPVPTGPAPLPPSAPITEPPTV